MIFHKSNILIKGHRARLHCVKTSTWHPIHSYVKLPENYGKNPTKFWGEFEKTAIKHIGRDGPPRVVIVCPSIFQYYKFQRCEANCGLR